MLWFHLFVAPTAPQGKFWVQPGARSREDKEGGSFPPSREGGLFLPGHAGPSDSGTHTCTVNEGLLTLSHRLCGLWHGRRWVAPLWTWCVCGRTCLEGAPVPRVLCPASLPSGLGDKASYKPLVHKGRCSGLGAGAGSYGACQHSTVQAKPCVQLCSYLGEAGLRMKPMTQSRQPALQVGSAGKEKRHVWGLSRKTLQSEKQGGGGWRGSQRGSQKGETNEVIS